MIISKNRDFLVRKVNIMIGLESKTLHSARLEYRLLDEKDKAPLSVLLHDRSVTEPAGFLPADSEESFDRFFAELTQYNTGIAILYGREVIGYFHVNKYVPDREEYQTLKCVGVGFVIGKDYQNRGFGTETLTCLTEYLLTIFDACFADHFKENIPSKRVIEKSGYSYCEDYSMFFDGIGTEKICSSYICRK